MADDEIQRYVGYGTNLAGALTGAAVGAATTGDPSGAVWGAALGASVEAALAETSHRALSTRRKVRVGAVIVLARETLFASFGKGHMLRSDDFMRARLDGRASVDEVIEHVLQVAEDTYEERKLPHIAAVLANVATSTQVDAATAHWVLTAVRGMSWQKLVAIALIGDQENNPLPEIERDGGDTWRSWSAREVFTELYYVDQMIGYGASEEGRPRGPRINDFSLTSKSNLIFHIADLTSISNEQRREFLQALTDEDGERHVTEVEVR